MKVRIKLIKFISIMLVMMLTQFAACDKSSQKQNAQQQSTQSEQQSNKVPSDLTELENNIEIIVKTLDGPAVQVKEETQQGKQGTSSGQEKQDTKKDQTGSKSKEEGQDKQGDKSQQGGQSGQQSQGQQQSQAPSTTQQPQQSQDPMGKIVPIINKMHYQWNNLMSVAVKKGAKKDLVNNFDNALNSLSNTVIGKNKTDTLMAASYLYAYIPDLYSLFETKASPEIKRIRHYLRNAILNSLTANWTQADLDIANLKSIWSLYKNALSKEHQDMVNKFDVSIYELEKVVKERNQHLIDIKGRVAFSNIEALEKAAGGESNKGTQSGGGQSESQSSGGQSGSQQSGGGQSGGGQSSVYSYIRHLLDSLLKK